MKLHERAAISKFAHRRRGEWGVFEKHACAEQFQAGLTIQAKSSVVARYPAWAYKTRVARLGTACSLRRDRGFESVFLNFTLGFHGHRGADA
jgi:hypothetical protein